MKFYYIRADGSVSVATPTPGSASLYIYTDDDAHLAPFMYWILSAMENLL